MRNWIQWDQAAVDDVVNHITTEIAPYDVFSNYSLASIQASIPAMFDQNQADGITLIFPDYDGDDLTAEKASQLTHIIKSIYEGLPNRANLEINVAFDFALLALSSDVKGQNSEPLWQETKPLLDFLENLLIKQPYVVTTDPNAQQTEAFAPSTRVDDKVIDNLLLFLELPTSISKKILRLRIERSDFRGTNREAVLRSIIPVIPPGGHKLIHEAPRPDAAPDAAPVNFSQFSDDLVYFRDNFSGVGFWSALHSESPEYDTLTNELIVEFGPKRDDPNKVTTDLQTLITSFCGRVCPNRAVIMLGVLGTFVAVLLLARQAWYVGWANRIAHRMFYYFGAITVMNFAMLITLLALWKCDPLSVAPKWMFWGLLITLLVLWMYKSYQRIKNGPKP